MKNFSSRPFEVDGQSTKTVFNETWDSHPWLERLKSSYMEFKRRIHLSGRHMMVLRQSIGGCRFWLRSSDQDIDRTHHAYHLANIVIRYRLDQNFPKLAVYMEYSRSISSSVNCISHFGACWALPPSLFAGVPLLFQEPTFITELQASNV